MTPVAYIQNADKDQIKKVSKQIAIALAQRIILGLVVTVAVTLASTAILDAISPTDKSE